MSPRNFINHPAWQAEDLGLPIPSSIHAVSVTLPRWQDVVGYEEKWPDVVSRLQSGYPRFVIHSLVQQIAQELGQGRPCLPLPSRTAAEKCATFIRKSTGEAADPVLLRGMHGVVTTENGSAALRAFWQHTGLIICSRQAEAWLAGQTECPDAKAIRQSLREQLAGFYGCAPDDVFLTPTGMAAHFAALQAVQKRTPGQATAQLGFPYVDTYKLQEKFGHGGHLLYNLDRIVEDLQELMTRHPLAACFCEIPGNPLLGSADLRQITPILRQRGVPLIVDDVVATPFNIDLSSHADLVVTSLTKYIVGTGDAMGGAVICHSRSPFYQELKAILRAQHEELLWGDEAQVLDSQAHGFPSRMLKHNANGLLIADRLRRHPAVERVWYPKWEFKDIYEALRRPNGGWGSLLTFLPKNAETEAPRIFDRMQVCKGPSLGTVFTLACPFTLLAHYTELAWAEANGVPRNLIRLSVGVEEPETLWKRIEAGFKP
jgi:cystathionine gamma-synthase